TENAPSADVTENAPSADIAENAPSADVTEDAPSADAQGASTDSAPAQQPAEQPAEAPAEATAEATAEAAEPSGGSRPAPAPRPAPRPPLPGRRPAAAPAAPVPPVDARDAAEAAAWGRVDPDGTVWVREATGERTVGQYPGADTEEALGFYVRRFLDLQAQVALFEARLPQLQPKEIEQTLATLTEALAEPAAVR